MAKKEPRSLYGQVVAITGAARGIGKATARALARQGARVAIGDLDVESPGRPPRSSAAASGVRLDVCRPRLVRAFLDEVERTLGPVDVLINNAGIMPLGPFDEEDDATILRQIDINLVGVMTGCKLVIPTDEAARPRPHREHRLDRGSRGLRRRRHLLHDEVRGRRPLRGPAGRAARHRDRAFGRDARAWSTPSSARA